jgi:mRNA-degrading endonuclease RelE of RelBE toxin-antitoxin system
MNLESGLSAYKVIPTDKFQRTIKNLKKSYKSERSQSAFVDCISSIITTLSKNPRSDELNTFQEPLPKGIQLAAWEFRKLIFSMPDYQGAKGQGRLMYLVNDSDLLIKLVWIYTHEEFQKRPPDKELKPLISDALDT